MTACSCGAPHQPGDRFCRACGRSLTAPASRQRPALALGGLALVIAGAWALFQWPRGEATEPPTEDAATVDGEDEQSTDEESSDEESTDPAGESLDEEESLDERDSPDEEDEFEPTADGRLGPLETTEVAAGEPMLGELTGLGLLVGGDSPNANLRVISLDTGEEQPVGAITGRRPVGVIDNLVVLDGQGAIEVMDLADPDREPVSVVERPDESEGPVEIDRGRIWVLSLGDEISTEDESPSPIAVLYQPDGTKLSEFPIEPGALGVLSPISDDLASNRGGGVYRRTADGFERLSTGALQAIGEEIVLLYECDDRFNCATQWRDRTSWARLPLPVPEGGESRTSIADLTANDRWLVITSLFDGETTIIDVETGTERLRLPPLAGDILDGQISFSPDGRWLVDPSEQQLRIVDLEAMTAWDTGEPQQFEGSAVLVDLADTPFASE